MDKPQIQVRIHDRRWGVFNNGDNVPKSTHDRKADAVEAAKELASKRQAEVIVFTLDGHQQ